VKIGVRDGDIYVEAHADIYQVGFDYVAAATKQLEDREWSSRVDWARLSDALQLKNGVPTRISQGGRPRPVAFNKTPQRTDSKTGS
jgi:L,D-transpeptidase ErfK/SrfK